MSRTFGVVLLGAIGAILPNWSASAQPPKDPLLKAVTAPAGQVRVRVPLTEGEKLAIQMRGQVPNPKKKGEYIDCSAALDTMNKSVVTSKMLEKWGYKPMGMTFVLPELLLSGNQVGAKSGKTDLFFRVQNLKFDVVEMSPDGTDQLFGADMIVNLPDVLRSASRTHEARFNFPDRFLDMSVPQMAVKRPGTGDELLPEPTPSDDPKLTVVACPLSLTPGLSFTGSSINGQDTFTMPSGKVQPVTPFLASATHGGSGIIMNIGMARALKLDVDLTKEAVKGSSTDKRLRLIEYTVKELRLGTMTGPGLKTPQDLVFTDVPIWIETTESEPMMWIGYPFLVKHFKDGVLAYTADGKAAMHGRVAPELLQAPRVKKK